ERERWLGLPPSVTTNMQEFLEQVPTTRIRHKPLHPLFASIYIEEHLPMKTQLRLGFSLLT
ncbi:hypothetical protein, partial [Klebsiella pneumoniae]|uniref:hypothetical protein n=1 Tax=Klebsiella pneumoniae TaxID=573 RepID=UPI00273139FE